MESKRSRKQNITFIILGSKNLGETDKVIFLYTNEYGLLHVIARNSRKITSNFTGKLIQLSYGSAELYFGPKRILITEIKSTNLIGLENNLETIQYAQEIASITKAITPENQKYNRLIDLIKISICSLKESNKKYLIFSAFIVKLFDLAGLIPDFKTINNKTESKYLKFFHYIQTEKFEKINKLHLNKNEKQYITSKIESLIENII